MKTGISLHIDRVRALRAAGYACQREDSDTGERCGAPAPFAVPGLALSHEVLCYRHGTDLREAQRAEARAALVSEKLRACYAPGLRRGYVYRMYDAEGLLLYVGKTYRVKQRLEGHAKDKPWFGDVARLEVRIYKNEDAALAAEAWAIKRENPLHNRAHPEPWTPTAPRALLTYSGDL